MFLQICLSLSFEIGINKYLKTSIDRQGVYDFVLHITSKYIPLVNLSRFYGTETSCKIMKMSRNLQLAKYIGKKMKIL